MKQGILALALAAAFGSASAAVVCNGCAYQDVPAAATYLGAHSPVTADNSTFGNAQTGLGVNGFFENWWVFDIDPAGAASVNAIFLPIGNIDDFNVDVYAVENAVCGPNPGAACGLLLPKITIDLNAVMTVNPPIAFGSDLPGNEWSSTIDFTPIDAGRYAFSVTGIISGLGPQQPASYSGNLQTQMTRIPEPSSALLAGLGLIGLAATARKGKGKAN